MAPGCSDECHEHFNGLRRQGDHLAATQQAAPQRVEAIRARTRMLWRAGSACGDTFPKIDFSLRTSAPAVALKRHPASRLYAQSIEVSHMLTESAIQKLRETLRGQIFRPGDPGYDAAPYAA